MGLKGYKEYMEKNYTQCSLKEAIESGEKKVLNLHSQKEIDAILLEDQVYDLKIKNEQGEEEVIPKLFIKYLYNPEDREAIKKLIKTDKNVADKKLEPIEKPHLRIHIKNRTLLSLLYQREVVIFTLLEGDVIRGLISRFTRYEITVLQKGGIPVTFMRHALYNARNKKNRSLLKSFQQKHKDWKKSELYKENE